MRLSKTFCTTYDDEKQDETSSKIYIVGQSDAVNTLNICVTWDEENNIPAADVLALKTSLKAKK